MGMDSIDMSLDDVIKSGGSGKGKGRGKGKTKSSKGKGKADNGVAKKGVVASARLWGGSFSKTKGNGRVVKGGGGAKKADTSAKKLDMTLDEVVEAEWADGKGRNKGEGRSKGKGKDGKDTRSSTRIVSASGGKSNGGRYEKGEKGGGYSSKGSYKGSTKGGSKGKSSWSSKGYGQSSWGPSKGKGRKGFTDDVGYKPVWSQHDDWRAVEEDEGYTPRSGFSYDSYRGKGKSKSAFQDDGYSRGPMRMVSRATGRDSGISRGGAATGSWADRMGGAGDAWRRVEQDDDESPLPPRRRVAPLGVASRAAPVRETPRKAPAAREREAPERRPVRGQAPAAREREERAAPAEPRRRAREEAAPPAAAAKRSRREEAVPAPAAKPKRIKVTNIARDLDEIDIKEAFEAETGRILKCILDRSTALITFSKAEDARKAVETFDRGELNGKTISVVLDP